MEGRDAVANGLGEAHALAFAKLLGRCAGMHSKVVFILIYTEREDTVVFFMT
jgi:hypothetical protein